MERCGGSQFDREGERMRGATESDRERRGREERREEERERRERGGRGSVSRLSLCCGGRKEREREKE
jgi:hypothetical protein